MASTARCDTCGGTFPLHVALGCTGRWQEPELVFVPPATPEEEAEARERWIAMMDWLATLGAMDA